MIRRIVTEDKGYVPDYQFSVREFKKRLGIAERGNVQNVRILGDEITVSMPRSRDQRVRYQASQREFKDALGITDERPVLIVFASVWSSTIQISMICEKRRHESQR